MDKGVRCYKSTLNKEIKSPRSAYGALSLTIPKVEEPMTGLRVRLTNLSKAVVLQKAFDGQTESQPAAEKALYAVRRVFGDKIIQKGSEIQTDRRSLLLREW